MASAVEQLTDLIEDDNRYDIPLAELLPLQIAAANERFQSRLPRLSLLANRAQEGGITEIKSPADLVPLLFAHTAYKSYPEGWLSQAKWDRMERWLGTVTPYPVANPDAKNATDIDDWIARLAEGGHFVSCSSGTTGKVSMINSSMADRRFNRRSAVSSLQWATGIDPDHSRKVFRCNPPSNNVRNIDTGSAFTDAFGSAETAYRYPSGPITIGQVREMVVLRKRMADGSALPGEIAAFEETSAKRAQAMEEAINGIAHSIAEHRSEKLLITGMFSQLFKISEIIRGLGFSNKDFHPENAMMVGGGLKGAVLPDDYREQILDLFNIAPNHIYQMYGMQELNTHFPRCSAGRYHTAPWIMLLLLDQTGETLLPPSDGETEGRAAFFDLSHVGRWGGLISGDKIHVRHGKCDCGHQGPTISADIMRYADLSGGDNISCAGTIDAYVRGVS